MPWILLLVATLFCAPLQAVTLPGVTTSATSTTSQTPPVEPDAAQKKSRLRRVG